MKSQPPKVKAKHLRVPEQSTNPIYKFVKEQARAVAAAGSTKGKPTSVAPGKDHSGGAEDAEPAQAAGAGTGSGSLPAAPASKVPVSHHIYFNSDGEETPIPDGRPSTSGQAKVGSVPPPQAPHGIDQAQFDKDDRIYKEAGAIGLLSDIMRSVKARSDGKIDRTLEYLVAKASLADADTKAIKENLINLSSVLSAMVLKVDEASKAGGQAAQAAGSSYQPTEQEAKLLAEEAAVAQAVAEMAGLNAAATSEEVEPYHPDNEGMKAAGLNAAATAATMAMTTRTTRARARAAARTATPLRQPAAAPARRAASATTRSTPTTRCVGRARGRRAGCLTRPNFQANWTRMCRMP